MATVTSSHNPAGVLRIYINGGLHLAFSTTTMAGMQSWRMAREPAMFAIEITPASGKSILAEYDDEALWRDVLGAIDAVFGCAPTASRAADAVKTERA